jgi:hypothetical protein
MSVPFPFPGPIPAYTNPPIQPQFYEPSQLTITDIDLGFTTTVTLSATHEYVVGQLVRFLIPTPFRSYQLNNQTAVVIDIPQPNQVTVDINSNDVNPFVASPPSTTQIAQIIPVGDYNSGQINSSGTTDQGTFIPGSFINVSPRFT